MTDKPNNAEKDLRAPEGIRNGAREDTSRISTILISSK